MDWVDKEADILQDVTLHEEFNQTKEYEEAFLNWHRETHPEDWGND